MKKEKIRAAAVRFAQLGAVFVCTMAVFFIALLLTALIPKDAIRNNLISTAEYYTSGQPFPMNDNVLHSAQDNYADCILFNIISSVDGNNLLYSLMSADYYVNENNNVSAGLTLSAEMDVAPNVDYSRYWHGSMVFLRPLLTIMDVRGIKALSWIVLMTLAAVVGWLLIRREQAEALVFLLVGMFCVQIWFVPSTLCYAATFMIMLAVSAAFILFEEKKSGVLPVIAVISGCSACFVDFLTTETITITVPLLIVLIMRHKDGREGNIKENLLFVVSNGAAWGISYGLAYVTKWLLAAAVTGDNSVGMAVEAAKVRVNGGGIFTSLMRNIACFYPFKNVGDITGVYITAAILAVLAALYFAFRKKGAVKNHAFTIAALAVGAVPYLRFMVLNAHSSDHCFFTYRAQIAAVMAVAAVFWFGLRSVPAKKKKN